MANDGVAQLLHSTAHGRASTSDEHGSPLLGSKRECEGSSFAEEDDDIQPINGVVDFAREFFNESNKLWCLAAPAVFTSYCQYGLITVTQIFAGHLGTNQLAAVSVENSIISGIPYGLMVCHTILALFVQSGINCGQAFGANRYEMLGIYMQRAMVILNAMAFASVPLFLFATPVLKFFGQTTSVVDDPRALCIRHDIPRGKFLQAQSKVIVLAVIAAVALCLQAFLSWLLITVLGYGLAGAAMALDASWWFITIAQISIIMAGTFK